MDGFLICQPWANHIINGKKKHEYRSTKTTKLNERIVILSKGYALGVIKFTKVTKHCRGYAWKIKLIRKYKKPRKYIHKHGAIRWIKNVEIK